MKLSSFISLSSPFEKSLLCLLAFSLLFTNLTAEPLVRFDLLRHLPDNREDNLNSLFITDEGVFVANETNPHVIEEQINTYLNIQYSITLAFGDSAEPFRALIDTGSSWVWIPNKDFQGKNFLHHYNCQSKLGCNIIDSKVQSLRYGKGEVTGVIAEDTVCIAHTPHCVEKQAFYLISSQKDLDSVQAEGLVGLGPRTEVNGHKMILASLKEQGVIKQMVFSIYLPGTNGRKSHAGELILGGYDYEYARNKEFIYQNLVSDKYWAVNLTEGRLTMHGKMELRTQETGYMAMVDSGTSCIHIPYDIYESFMDQVSDIAQEDYLKVWSSMKYMQCSKTLLQRLPTLELIFGSTVFKIEPKDYVLWDDDRDTFCLILLLPSPSTDMWVLGDVFMRTVYTLFDLENRRIGFLKNIDQELEAAVIPSVFVWDKTKMLLVIFSVAFFAVVLLGKLYMRRKAKAAESLAETQIKILEINTFASGSSTYTKNTI